MTNETILYIVCAILISFFIATFQYKKKGKNYIKEHLLFIMLRFITIATILLLLFNPKLKKTTVFVEKPTLVVAVDNSSSTTFLEQAEKSKDFVQRINTNSNLKDRFDLELITFGDHVMPMDTLSFRENQTRISEALTSIKEVYRNKKSPVLLISDGNQTYGEDYTFSSVNFPQNIYPVVLGDTIEYIDLSITQLNVNKYAYYKNEFPLEVILNYKGNNDIETVFEITKGNTTVYSERLNFSDNSRSKIISTTLPARDIGVQVYKASLRPNQEERNKVNNNKEFAIEVIDQKTNILLVSDIVHPDIGVFKKSIESNELRSVEIAKSAVNSTELDNYQMVILYQPNSRFKNIIDEINKRNLNSLIVTGTKTDWNFLNRIQNQFNKENVRQTEDVQAALNTGYTNFAIDDIGFYEYPPLEDFLGDINISSSVDVILNQRIRNIETGNPLLFTLENEGKRQAVLLGENIWKWRAQNYLDTKEFKDFDEFIGKIVFYLATNKQRNRLDVNFEPFYNGSTEIKITAQYFNKNYEFDTNASVSIRLENKTVNSFRTVPLLLKNNHYEVDLSGIEPGEYDFVVSVANEQLSRSGSFKILDFDIEKQFLNADIDKLNKLAENSGGQLFFPDQFSDIENSLLSNEAYKPIQKSKENSVPLIDWKYLLALIVIALSVEWFLRKYNGLI
ncbi:VWA domain-containing protein [Flavobacteriaceae bacterium R38]|nr:VWA domain-containing protein [Flavobacteriaceae bacterium R38]